MRLKLGILRKGNSVQGIAQGQAEKVGRSVNGPSAESRKFVLSQTLLLAHIFF